MEPLEAFEVESLKEAWKKITLVCQREKIERIVLGLPKGRLASKVKKFGRELKEKTGLPVFFQDEDLTSQEAVREMIAIGKPKKRRKKEEHLLAACLILESYLDLLGETR